MRHLNDLLLKLTIRVGNLKRDLKGQDLIEYALMAGFVAVAAGALMPNVASSISIVFSKVSSVMADAAAS
jgi:Flp pilus assembly pilin Flp